MIRRSFAPAVFFLASLAAGCVSAETDSALPDGEAGEATTAASVAAGQPNIVLILLDDLDKVVTEPFYADVLPHVMALKEQGVYFENAFAPTSICCAARAGILSGKYGHNTDVLTNGGDQGGWAQFQDDEPFAVAARLSQAGYRTGAFGKYLNGFQVDGDGVPPAVPPGWTDWHVFVDSGVSYTGYNYLLHHYSASTGAAPTVTQYGAAESDYSTDVLRDEALSMIRSAEGEDDRPFFMYVTPTAPHLPLQAAPRHQALAAQWTAGTFPTSRPNYYADGATIEDKPAWLESTWDERSQAQTRAWNFADWKGRMGSLYAADELVQSIVEELQAKGEWDNTLLVFASDNGYNHGAHALLHKMAPYEESIRVPLLIAGGAALGLRKNVTETRTVTHVDYFPTFLELAGLTVPSDADGHSLVPLIKQGAAPVSWRTDFLEQYAGSGAEDGIGLEIPAAYYTVAPAFVLDIPKYRAVRAQKTVYDNGAPRQTVLKLVEWYGDAEQGSIHEYEMYDLGKDPYELANLLHHEPLKYAAAAQSMKARLAELQTCAGASCR